MLSSAGETLPHDLGSSSTNDGFLFPQSLSEMSPVAEKWVMVRRHAQPAQVR